MGLFNIFKKADPFKETATKMNAELFPGGKHQMDTEIEYVKQYLHNRYTTEQVRSIFIYALTMWYLYDERRNKVDLVNTIVNNKDLSITREDATLVYNSCVTKFSSGMRLDHVINNLQSGSNSDKIFMIATGGIVELKNKFKDLSKEGKFEIIMFNVIMLMEFLKSVQSAEKKKDLILELLGLTIADGKKIGLEINDVMDLLNARTTPYLNIINENGDVKDDKALQLYYNFYVNPLSRNQNFNEAIYAEQYQQFLPAFNAMVRWVRNSYAKVKGVANLS